MSFYLPLPSGEISIFEMRKAIEERLECYQRLYSDDVRKIFGNLKTLSSPGSEPDCLSHHLLSVKTFDNARLGRFFLRNEVKLMELRFADFTEIDLKKFLKKLRFEAQDLLETRKHYFMSEAREKMCLECVRVSLLLLRGGALEHAFKEHKNDELCQDCDNFCIPMNGLLSRAFPEPGSTNPGSFPQSAIDKVFTDFPPCVRRMYDVLQKDNRLVHQSRYNFSVFLKCIGLSLEDQLSYWEEIYLKEPGKDSKCTHTWEQNNKRYIYSIRHMYGLEGIKQESFVKPCIDIEDIKLAVNEEGGCPFANDDDQSLKKLLKNSSPIDAEDIEVIIQERKKLPQKGCKAYFQTNIWKKYKCRVPDDQINFENPAEFYLLANKFETKRDQTLQDYFETSSSSDEENLSSDGEANNTEATLPSSSSSDEDLLPDKSHSSSDGSEETMKV